MMVPQWAARSPDTVFLASLTSDEIFIWFEVGKVREGEKGEEFLLSVAGDTNGFAKVEVREV